jgi:hypothetical protein
VDGQTRRLFAFVLIVAFTATAAVAILVNGGTAGPDGSSNASSVIGVVVGVQSEGLDRVRGFTVRTQDAATVAFTVGDLENGAAFPPGHLVEHQATAQPVRVWYVVDGRTNMAIRIEDAP